MVGHARGKWIGGAEKGIAHAKTALAKATNAAAEKALVERQAILDAALRDEPKFSKAHAAAQAALATAKENETKASESLLASLGSALTSDKMEAKLAKAVVLTVATPRGLAEFASQAAGKAGRIDKLPNDPALMKAMLITGGANRGHYGCAAEILETPWQPRVITSVSRLPPPSGRSARNSRRRTRRNGKWLRPRFPKKTRKYPCGQVRNS